MIRPDALAVALSVAAAVGAGLLAVGESGWTGGVRDRIRPGRVLAPGEGERRGGIRLLPALPYWGRRQGARVDPTLAAELWTELAGHLRSGMTFPQALHAMGEEHGFPLHGVLLAAAEQAERGNWEGVRANLARALGDEASSSLAAALDVQRRTGGDLGPIFERLAESVRSAALRRREVRAKTAEARWSVWLLGASPLGVLGYAAAFHPRLLDGLAASPLGIAALAYAAASWCIGLVAMRRLLRRVAGEPAREEEGGRPG